MIRLYKSLFASALLSFVLSPANAQFAQQGPKLVGSGPSGIDQGMSVALSADGNTALVGGNDGGHAGGAWVFTRSGGVWSQQGPRLVGANASANAEQGDAVALSGDGNTAIVGGPGDNGGIGAAWIFTRSGNAWSQQSKLVGSGAAGLAFQGWSVALSADGNTALVSGRGDNSFSGALWVFTRSGGVWTQQGGKLISPNTNELGLSVALSADGNTAIAGGHNTSGIGVGCVFVRTGSIWSQQGGKLSGSDAITGGFGLNVPVALAADGNTAMLGWPGDHTFVGAAWVFTRSGAVWSQQGAKLVGSGANANGYGRGYDFQGASVALSADGNTAAMGGYADDKQLGAAWVFQRSNGAWSQLGNKLVGSDAIRNLDGAVFQGFSVALSADGHTALVGGQLDNNNTGAAWVFTALTPSTTALSSSASPSAYGQSVTFTATVTGGASGSVTFTVDGVPQASVPVTAGIAKSTVSNLSAGQHSISALYGGDATYLASTGTLTQTVTPIGTISLWSNTVIAPGQSTRMPVSLVSPAPVNGLTIFLTSDDPSKVTITPSVFIAGGKTSPSVQAQVTGVSLGIAHITASALGLASDAESVRVTATLSFATCCVTFGPATTQGVTLSLSVPAPSGGLIISLSSDNTSIATVPPSVTLPANATKVTVPVTAVGVGGTVIRTSGQPDLIDASMKITVH